MKKRNSQLCYMFIFFAIVITMAIILPLALKSSPVCEKYYPINHTGECWFKLHRGTDVVVENIRILNYTEGGKTECTRLWEMCRLMSTCWWDAKTKGCNCDVLKMAAGPNWTLDDAIERIKELKP